jgi:hypothetical protein
MGVISYDLVEAWMIRLSLLGEGGLRCGECIMFMHP